MNVLSAELGIVVVTHAFILIIKTYLESDEHVRSSQKGVGSFILKPEVRRDASKRSQSESWHNCKCQREAAGPRQCAPTLATLAASTSRTTVRSGIRSFGKKRWSPRIVFWSLRHGHVRNTVDEPVALRSPKPLQEKGAVTQCAVPERPCGSPGPVLRPRLHLLLLRLLCLCLLLLLLLAHEQGLRVEKCHRRAVVDHK